MVHLFAQSSHIAGQPDRSGCCICCTAGCQYLLACASRCNSSSPAGRQMQSANIGKDTLYTCTQNLRLQILKHPRMHGDILHNNGYKRQGIRRQPCLKNTKQNMNWYVTSNPYLLQFEGTGLRNKQLSVGWNETFHQLYMHPLHRCQHWTKGAGIYASFSTCQ